MAVTVSSMPNHIKEMKGIQSFTKIAKDDLVDDFQGMYRVSHVHLDLGWVDLDLGSSPGWCAPSVATYYPCRVVEHPKSKSTKPSLRGHGTPCTDVSPCKCLLAVLS